MSEKLQNIPTWVIITVAVAILGLAGIFIFRSIQNNTDASFHAPASTPDQQKRYQDEMAKRRGAGGGYQSSGAPGVGGRPTGGGPGGPGGRPMGGPGNVR